MHFNRSKRKDLGHMFINKTQLETSLENITKADSVDAIVNSSNTQLYGRHGVNGAIHKAAGNELRLSCEKLGGCKPGEAKITDAYALPCKYIIHTVGPIWQDGLQDEESTLKSCYTNVLNLAVACGIRSIGFPSISTGKHGFPADKAALIAVNTVSGYVEKHPDSFDHIIWFFHKEDTKKLYDVALTLMESVSQVRASVQRPDLPMQRIGFENSVIYTSTLNEILNKQKGVLIKGILTVLDSEGSQKKHLITAGYLPHKKIFYMGLQTMMTVKKSGVPLCRVISETEYINHIEGKKTLNTIQNLLKQYGYHAKGLENLTSIQRQTILAMLIERNIISADDLIKYLDELIQIGKNKPFYHQDAKNLGKWRSDSDFVSLYVMN